MDCPDGNCDCPITCKNCGVLDEKNCKCICPPGWDGIGRINKDFIALAIR